MDQVLQKLVSIETKLDALVLHHKGSAVDTEGAMKHTGCRTKRAQRLWFKRHGVKPYERGKYRLAEIQHKIAQLRFSQPN